jgi:hypothetical protein
MAKVLCVLYDDPVGGYPGSYARDGVPKIERYPGSQTTPTPNPANFSALCRGSLDCVSSWRVWATPLS